MKANEIKKKCKNQKMINLLTIEQYIFSCFHQKYFVDQYTYGSVVINNIIYNEKTNIVATFKDYLISDDISEFLKRYYTTIESSIRLPKFFEYYETYSRIYPNYTILPEAKYIYKNIHKKQKMIDKQQKNESEEKKKVNKKHKRNNEKDDLVFSTDIYNSIINDSEDLYNLLFGINKNCENSEKTQEDFNKIINEINKFENPFYNDISYEKDNTNTKNSNIKNNLNNYNRNIKGKLFSLCSKTKNKDSKSNNFINGKYNNGNLLKELQILNSFNHRKANSSTSNNTSIKKINKNSSNKINKNINNNNININIYSIEEMKRPRANTNLTHIRGKNKYKINEYLITDESHHNVNNSVINRTSTSINSQFNKKHQSKTKNVSKSKNKKKSKFYQDNIKSIFDSIESSDKNIFDLNKTEENINKKESTLNKNKNLNNSMNILHTNINKNYSNNHKLIQSTEHILSKTKHHNKKQSKFKPSNNIDNSININSSKITISKTHKIINELDIINRTNIIPSKTKKNYHKKNILHLLILYV